MVRLIFYAFVVLAVLLPTLLTTLGWAAESDPAPNPIVAVINGQEIRRADVMALAPTLPKNMQGLLPETMFPVLLKRVVALTLVTQAADEAGIRETEAYKRQADDLAQRLFLEQVTLREVTEDRINVAYWAMKATKGLEIKARHILVKTEEQALALIAELKADADFATLAKKHSTGPSGPRGGDLGFFSPRKMVKPFADAVMAMEDGTFSQTPVKTRFGWHIILREAMRTPEIPPKRKIRDQLVRTVSEQAVTELVLNLQKKATIEVYGFDGR